MLSDIHEAIEVRAYFLYLSEGRPEGHALDHWLLAERQTIAEEDSLKATAISAEPVEPVEPSESILGSHPVASVTIMGVIGGLVGGPIGAIAGVSVGAVGASIQTAADHMKKV